MLRRLLRRLRAALGSATSERDLRDELQFHLDQAIAGYVRSGMSPPDARAAALREFGGVEQAKEACRDAWGMRLIREARQDVRYAGRMLRRDLGLTMVVMATLAVGIGANTALFSVVDAVLLKPLPFPDADRLVIVKEQTASRPNRAVAYPDFLDWSARQSTFDSMSAAMIIGGVLSGDGSDAERVFGRAVNREFFATLGTSLQLGRTFTAEEDQPGGARVLVISNAVWQRRYGGDRSAVGRFTNYNGESYTIVGVLPPTFDFYGRANANNDVFLPLGHLRNRSYMQSRDDYPINVVGRMKRDVSVDRARTDLAAIAASLERQHPGSNRGVGVTVTPLLEDYVGDMRLALSVLLGASWLLLTIACVNVANLLLARASTRRQEIAVRLALGAGRGRVIRQLLTESLVLSSMGGAAGLFFAWIASGWFARSAPVALSRMEEVALDWRVALFGAATTILTGLVFGLAPALQTSGVDLQQAMRASGRSIAGTGKRLREALVVGQVALCVALLIATGLLVRSFQRLIAVEPGYAPAHVVSMRLRLPDARYRTRDQVLPVLDDVMKRIAAIPGVDSACLTTGVPLGRRSDKPFAVNGQPEERRDRAPLVLTQWISPDCHRTFGISLLAGRSFTSADRAGAAPVAIVDDEFVRRHLPGRQLADAIGERVRLIDEEDNAREIVGVVRHIRHSGLDEDARPELYVPFEQAQPGWQLEVGRAMDIAVRSTTASDATVAAIRAKIREFDPELPLSHVITLEAALERSMGPRLFNMVLIAVFGGAALLLCVVGIYGVISYSVSQRTRELGVRMTLGAPPASVIRMLMTRAIGIVLAGVAGGVMTALLLGRLVEGLLFGVRARDPLTFVTVVVLLTGVAAVASYLPARRAAGLDLTAALRQD
jgi:putative ABC transport system permease protein